LGQVVTTGVPLVWPLDRRVRLGDLVEFAGVVDRGGGVAGGDRVQDVLRHLGRIVASTAVAMPIDELPPRIRIDCLGRASRPAVKEP
jgi:hypothetical protein